MNRDLPWGRIAFAVVGYLAAVLIAVTVTVFAMLLPTVLPDNGAWGSFYAYSRELATIYGLGLEITFATALPGFLLTLFVARRGIWIGWLPFACAGTLNAVLAKLVFCAFVGVPLLKPTDVFLSSLPGGFCGGLAYWAVVRRSLVDRWEAALS